MKKNGDGTKSRSWILFAVGILGIGYEQYTGEVNWILLLIFTLMTGVIGVTEFMSLIKSSSVVHLPSSSQQERSESVSDKSLPESLKDGHE